MNNARCSWEWKKRNEVHIVLLDGYMAPGYATGMWPSKSFFQSKYTIGITTRFGGFNLKDNAQNGSPLQVASTKMKQHLVTTTKRTQVHSKTCSLHFLQTWVSWWFRNPTNHLMYKNTANNGIFTISTGERRIFEPSTVSPENNGEEPTTSHEKFSLQASAPPTSGNVFGCPPGCGVSNQPSQRYLMYLAGLVKFPWRLSFP